MTFIIPGADGSAQAANEVRARIARRIAKLQRRAVELGEELYGERTRHFVATVAALPSAPMPHGRGSHAS